MSGSVGGGGCKRILPWRFADPNALATCWRCESGKPAALRCASSSRRSRLHSSPSGETFERTSWLMPICRSLKDEINVSAPAGACAPIRRPLQGGCNAVATQQAAARAARIHSVTRLHLWSHQTSALRWPQDTSNCYSQATPVERAVEEALLSDCLAKTLSKRLCESQVRVVGKRHGRKQRKGLQRKKSRKGKSVERGGREERGSSKLFSSTSPSSARAPARQ